MVSIEAESVQQDADCKKAMGREFKGTGDRSCSTHPPQSWEVDKWLVDRGLEFKDKASRQPSTNHGPWENFKEPPLPLPGPKPCYTQRLTPDTTVVVAAPPCWPPYPP